MALPTARAEHGLDCIGEIYTAGGYVPERHSLPEGLSTASSPA